MLIDNASSEPIAQRVNLSWHPSLRVLREEKLGLTHARLRGIKESTAELLIFVDDDNVLDADYLAQAASIAAAWPMIGAFSGQVRGQFEEQPPDWTRKYWHRLAIREFSSDRWSNIACLDHTTPNGAGLCVRRQVALAYLNYHESGKRKVVLDRAGKSLLSAGDLDLAATACDLGLGNGLFANLKLTHLIPRERLTEDYLLRLLEAQTTSAVVLESFRANGVEPMPRGWKREILDRLKPLSMNARDRRFLLAVQAGQRKAQALLHGKSEPVSAGDRVGSQE